MEVLLWWFMKRLAKTVAKGESVVAPSIWLYNSLLRKEWISQVITWERVKNIKKSKRLK